MATVFIPYSSDELVTCPFDKSHQILRARIHYHLVKCGKRHPNCNKIICPYDATEYLEPEDFPSHLFQCKSKMRIDGHEYVEEKMLKNKEHGHITNAPFHYPNLDPPDEDWASGVENIPDYRKRQINKPFNSSLTTKPQNVVSWGRGKLLKEHLEKVNNQCDGLNCTKPCCPKSTQPKAMGRAALLKHFREQEKPPIGRAVLLKLYSDQLRDQQLGTVKSSSGHGVDKSKEVEDVEKYEL